MMDAARSKTSLDDLKAPALTEDKTGDRNSDIGEGDLSVAMRRIVIAVDRKHTLDLDTGSTVGHKNHGLLLVGIWVIWVSLS
jgi:hypothetical protein